MFGPPDLDLLLSKGAVAPAVPGKKSPYFVGEIRGNEIRAAIPLVRGWNTSKLVFRLRTMSLVSDVAASRQSAAIRSSGC
jgi:hypothetical protein